VRVHEEVARFGAVIDPGCMKCMDCVSVCPKGALSFGFVPRVERAKQKRRSPRTWDLSWTEEGLAALVFLAALYAFRNLYDAVPFLLAIALAVLAAIAVIALGRSLLASGFTLQSFAWKRAGRMTRGGVLGLVVSSAFLAFAAHSGWVQFQERQGDVLLERAARAPVRSAERATALAGSRAHLERALSHGLVETAALHNKLGQILVAEGSGAAAEPHFVRAVELLPSNESARVYLADLAMARGDLDAALGRLEELCALDPLDPELERRVGALLGRAPEEPRVVALSVRMRAAREH
jgi:Flp pilus assembly protein TadD